MIQLTEEQIRAEAEQLAPTCSWEITVLHRNFWIDGYIAAASKYLPQAGEGWISCSERLPIKDKLVIWLYKDGSMNIGSGRPDMNSPYTLVTHWRELPAPPIDQQKKEEV